MSGFLLGINLAAISQLAGYIVVAVVIFAESGLLVGFFLPGDSLLITVGLLAEQGHFSFPILAAIAFVAAVAGDSVGYAIGRRAGPKVFNRKESFFFHHSYVDRAEAFYKKHGGKTIVLARFMPVVRTFVPVLAGVGKMPYRKFLAYNVIGGLVWGAGIVAAGYYLGRAVPGIDHYILYIIIGILVVSVAPLLFQFFRNPERRSALWAAAGKALKRKRR